MRRGIVVFAISYLWAAQVWAGGPGTTNANFLKAGQGVRPIALGETYTALGDGLDTLYWNPAGLVQIDSPLASFMHSFWIQDVGMEYLAYAMPLGPLGAVGGGVTILHTSIEQTLEDEFGNYAGTGAQVSALNFALVGTYSQKLSRLLPSPDPLIQNTLVGASLRLVSEGLPDGSIMGGALDIGAIWRQTEEIKPEHVATATGKVDFSDVKPVVRDRGWRAGFVAQNLGMTSEQLMPISFRAGVGYIEQGLFLPDGRGTLTLDALLPIDNDLKISLGAEFAHISPNTQFAVRLGYKIGNEIKDLDPLAGLTAGAGASIRAGVLTYQVDYSFVPYGELGSTHRASLTLAFLSGPNAGAAPILMDGLVAPSAAPAISPSLAASVSQPAEKKPEPPISNEVKTQMAPKPTPEMTTTSPDAAAASQTKPAAPVPSEEPQTETDSAASVDQQKAKLEQLQKMLDQIMKRVESGRYPAIEFKDGSNALAGDTKETLDQIGKLLERYPDGQVNVAGFAGSDKALAENRAKAVVQYLCLRFRVDRDRFTPQSGQGSPSGKSAVVLSVPGAEDQ